MELTKWLAGHRKVVVFGELGSGKTEIALNLALQLHRETGKPVRFMDMDQTKPMYRARDVQEKLEAQGVTVVADEQFMDAPTVAPGVREKMEDDVYTIMDVGGSFHGALNMGQFSWIIRHVGALVLYVINPYRPFSDSTEHISQTMAGILACCHLNRVSLISNPFAGEDTTLEDVLEGHTSLRRRVAPLQLPITAVVVPEALHEEAAAAIQEPCFAVTPFLPYVLNPIPTDSSQ